MDGFHGSAEPDGEMRAPRVSFNIKGRRAGVGSFGTNVRAEIAVSVNSVTNETDERFVPF